MIKVETTTAITVECEGTYEQMFKTMRVVRNLGFLVSAAFTPGPPPSFRVNGRRPVVKHLPDIDLPATLKEMLPWAKEETS